MNWFLRNLLIATPIILIAYSFVGSRLIKAIALLHDWPRQSVKWSVISVLVFLNLYPVIMAAASYFHLRSFFSGLRGGFRIIDYLFTFPFWAGLIVVFEVLPYFLLIALSGLFVTLFLPKTQIDWAKIQAVLFVLLFGFYAFYVVWRIMSDTLDIRLTEREVRIDRLQPALDGLKIAHLSDLQADPYTGHAKMQRYIDLANAQNPDLVVFCGDLVTSGTAHIEQGADMLQKLDARLGVYACLGDHDYWSSPQMVKDALNSRGIKTVEDSVVTINRGESAIALTILTNVYRHRPSPALLEQLSSAARPRAGLNVMVTHQPTRYIVEFAAQMDYDLILAGHTHGGQIVLRPFGIPVSAAHFDTEFYSGFYEIGKTILSVTNGLGLTLVPLRYQAPAEVTILTLHRTGTHEFSGSSE